MNRTFTRNATRLLTATVLSAAVSVAGSLAVPATAQATPTAPAGSTALSGTLAAPINPDPVVNDILNTVIHDRKKYAPQCPKLVYNPELDAVAQRVAASGFQPNDPRSEIISFYGAGDPRAAAVTDAYKNGAGAWLSRCEFTEVAVAFFRYESPALLGSSTDYVGIVFRKPSQSPPPAHRPIRRQSWCSGGWLRCRG